MVSKKSSDRFFPSFWFFTNVDVNGEEGIIPREQSGQIISESTFNEMVKKATLFYDSQKDHQGKMDKFNSYLRFNNDRQIHSFPQLEIGKSFELPEAIVKFKSFRPDLKRKWSCKCALCGTKVSSDKADGYYLLDFNGYIDHFGEEIEADWFGFRRACSPECAKVLWKTIFKEWIKANNYEEFFIID